jgi:hypothetical protein
MNLKIIPFAPDLSCACGSWLRHWENNTNWKAKLCPERYCRAYATVGTVVKKTDAHDPSLYVVPLCIEHHNMKDKEIEIIDVIKLVPANPDKNCGKNTVVSEPRNHEKI